GEQIPLTVEVLRGLSRFLVPLVEHNARRAKHDDHDAQEAGQDQPSRGWRHSKRLLSAGAGRRAAVLHVYLPYVRSVQDRWSICPAGRLTYRAGCLSNSERQPAEQKW